MHVKAPLGIVSRVCGTQVFNVFHIDIVGEGPNCCLDCCQNLCAVQLCCIFKASRLQVSLHLLQGYVRIGVGENGADMSGILFGVILAVFQVNALVICVGLETDVAIAAVQNFVIAGAKGVDAIGVPYIGLAGIGKNKQFCNCVFSVDLQHMLGLFISTGGVEGICTLARLDFNGFRNADPIGCGLCILGAAGLVFIQLSGHRTGSRHRNIAQAQAQNQHPRNRRVKNLFHTISSLIFLQNHLHCYTCSIPCCGYPKHCRVAAAIPKRFGSFPRPFLRTR